MKPKQLSQSISTPLLKQAALAILQKSDKQHYNQFMKVKEGEPKPVQKQAAKELMNSPRFPPEISKMKYQIRRQEVPRNHTEMANKIASL